MAIPWLADVLRGAGVTVIEEGNWLERGVSGSFNPIGVLWHHTAGTSSPSNPAPSLGTVINGRPDLPGPLAHALVDYNGVFRLISANRANHAGPTRESGPIPAGDGNTMLIGWEIDYDGVDQAMTTAQYQASVSATAAVLRHLGRDASYARGHRETSTTGKIDPSFVDLDVMRADVAARMAGGGGGDIGIVYHQIMRPDGSWSGFGPVPAPDGGASRGSRASIAGMPDGSALLVDIGPDGVLYHQIRRPDATWSGFRPVPAPDGGGSRGSRLSVAGMRDGSALLVDIGPDGVLYHQIRRPDATWSGFRPVPAPGGAPATGKGVGVAGMPDGSAQLVSIGPDGVLYHQIRRTDGTWSGFKPVPAPGGAPATGAEVSITGMPDGSALLVDIGPDGVLYHQIRRTDGTWSGFKPVPAPGGASASGKGVGVAGLPDGSALLVDIGPDSAFYHQIRRADGTWSGFVGQAARATDVAVTSTPDGAAHVVLVGH